MRYGSLKYVLRMELFKHSWVNRAIVTVTTFWMLVTTVVFMGLASRHLRQEGSSQVDITYSWVGGWVLRDSLVRYDTSNVASTMHTLGRGAGSTYWTIREVPVGLTQMLMLAVSFLTPSCRRPCTRTYWSLCRSPWPAPSFSPR